MVNNKEFYSVFKTESLFKVSHKGSNIGAVSYTHLDVYKRQIMTAFELLSEPIRKYVRDQRWEKLRPIQDTACLLYTSRCV